MEPELLAVNGRCSPTSSWWVSLTLLPRARLGAGKRISGEHGGDCNVIGEEIALHPLQPVFFYAKPDPTGTLTRKGDFAQVQARSKVDLPHKQG